MFRHTTLDPITITLGGVEQTIDFVAETTTIDGVSSTWTEEDRKRWPDATQIAAFQAEDAALVAGYAALENVRNGIIDALALTSLYPTASPETDEVIRATVFAAFEEYENLQNPPVDVVNLASSLIMKWSRK